MGNQRYSIIPGDFAEDARADVGHFRVLNLIGRHTDEHGWCRLKQNNIGDAIGLTRESVNRKLRDLTEWGYVEKHAEDATGRAIWYRTVMDRRAAPVAKSARPAEGGQPGPVNRGSHVGYNASPEPAAELHPTCDPSLTPGVIAGVTPGVIVRSHSKNDPSLTTKKDSPQPPAAAGGYAKRWGQDVRHSVDVRRAHEQAHPGLTPVVTEFVDRVRGLLNPPRQVDALAFYLELEVKLAGFSREALAATAARVLAGPQPRSEGARRRRALSTSGGRRNLPTVPEIVAIAAHEQRLVVLAAANERRVEVRLARDPELAALDGKLAAALAASLGQEVVEAWFGEAEIERKVGGEVEISVPVRFTARWITSHYEAPLLAAMRSVLPNVTRVLVVARQREAA